MRVTVVTYDSRFRARREVIYAGRDRAFYHTYRAHRQHSPAGRAGFATYSLQGFPTGFAKIRARVDGTKLTDASTGGRS
jgi:hypothetical protein